MIKKLKIYALLILLQISLLTTFIYSQTAALRIVYPNGGEVLSGNSEIDVLWISQNIDIVKIEYSIDNGENWLLIVDSTNAINGKYSWNVPNIPSKYCLMRITDQKAHTSSYSLNNFQISSGTSILIDHPKKGEEWDIGTIKNISWTSFEIQEPRFVIEYTIDSTNWKLISETSSFSTQWTIPNEPTINCQIRVTEMTTNTICISDTFTIHKLLPVEFLYPGIGIMQHSSPTMNILWNLIGIDLIDIDLVLDPRYYDNVTKEQTTINIVKNYNNNLGSCIWTLPKEVISYYSYQIKISESNNPAHFAKSYSFWIVNHTDIYDETIIVGYNLSDNYPNPFNPSTSINYSLPHESRVTISIFNLLGQKVVDLIDEIHTAGVYEANWNASNHSSGVYFYRINVTPTSGENSWTQTKNMILMK